MAKACPDANRFPRVTGNPVNQTSPRASGPRQLRFHFAKVEINSAFRKHSSAMGDEQNDTHIYGGCPSAMNTGFE
ncbi:hypothetical protein CEXT_650921 [Caerostris extrusa]|uniref:Uncharacterized protein n=1 Tax=Caerostris extrusa TaxID=172846 RepID=A0AAV4V1V0_CAEEX|nr:hypothetical protein CEXT_650921 [Caerostris extrusa]